MPTSVSCKYTEQLSVSTVSFTAVGKGERKGGLCSLVCPVSTHSSCQCVLFVSITAVGKCVAEKRKEGCTHKCIL